MQTLEDVESQILTILSDKQQIDYSDLEAYAKENNIDKGLLDKALSELEKAEVIASRDSGGIKVFYILEEESSIKRVFIVEDDKNINKLMALTLGKNYDITQIYNGREALDAIIREKPDLVILDLMLPEIDGLEICQKIKSNPATQDIIVIIVSAMDPTSNRFKGIKYGADYYIKKPFDPLELRNLVTIFLKKKGKKFDPLINLPNESKISQAVEEVLKSNYEIGRIKIEGLAEFAQKFGIDEGLTILRLVSQLLQDAVKEEKEAKVFLGLLDSGDFVIAGDKKGVEETISKLDKEFNAVLPFIYQDAGDFSSFGIEPIGYISKVKLGIKYISIGKNQIAEKKEEIIKERKLKENVSYSIGSYTYEELRKLLGSEDLDISITRGPGGVRLSVGKNKKE